MYNMSPCQTITHPLFQRHQIKVQIKRDDLIHPQISGNKWRKLKENIRFIKQHHYRGVVSFGGCYSNHLHALAFASQHYQFESIALVRGEKQHASNATLTQAQQWGMTLEFVDRKHYRLRNDADFLARLQQQYPEHLLIPEGGSNSLALQGVAELSTELAQQAEFDYLMTPVGSGGTLAGLIAADQNQHQLLGIAVLAQADYLRQEIKQLLPANAQQYDNWQLLTEFHRGGYAKFGTDDISRLLAFMRVTNLPLEPIYSGKMILALVDLINAGYFPAHSNIMLLHTGGLQGLDGLAERRLLNLHQWR
jgi:1-aminocyclopropane-1-carboxylate deaminase